MFIAAFPFKYYKFLPDFALATKIRQKSWNIDKLFPRLKERKAELRGLIKDIKSNLGNILKVRNPIELLSREIREGIKNLKYINFYDSTLLYLYYRLLHHVFDLCKKEEARLKAEMQNALSKEINPKDKAENVKKAKEDIEKDIKEHKKLIRSFDAAKRSLVDAYESLVRELRKRRWDAEKQAQHEFTFLKFTLRGMKNLNRKIKVEAIKVKTRITPQKAVLMSMIQRRKLKEINPEDVTRLAKLVSKAINRISKDVLYSSKLISKFENEMAKLKKMVENLKNTINNLVKDEQRRERIVKNITKPWGNVIRYKEEEINKDLMQIFSNIFVEYKYIGTRPLAT